jgi:signal transduction histidine kinase
MAAGVAHELRNPLATIGYTASLLRKRFGNEDELWTFIPEEVERMKRIVNDFLDLTRERPLVPAPDDLYAVVEHALRLTDAQLRQARVTARLAGNAPVRAYFDREQLQQVLLNLLLNAAEAMPEGGTLDVYVHKHRSGQQIEVRFEDSGKGFSAAALESFAEPFFTTKSTGSGLGLAVSTRIVERHGGALFARNRPEGGAAVGFTLPTIDKENHGDNACVDR